MLKGWREGGRPEAVAPARRGNPVQCNYKADLHNFSSPTSLSLSLSAVYESSWGNLRPLPPSFLHSSLDAAAHPKNTYLPRPPSILSSPPPPPPTLDREREHPLFLDFDLIVTFSRFESGPNKVDRRPSASVDITSSAANFEPQDCIYYDSECISAICGEALKFESRERRSLERRRTSDRDSRGEHNIANLAVQSSSSEGLRGFRFRNADRIILVHRDHLHIFAGMNIITRCVRRLP